ncbi:hypothetical protein Pelo_9824 [Pelomyxa schiedti]|nr:hypothetical protein Pelo_9824 [Pelomyxa schiedti]
MSYEAGRAWLSKTLDGDGAHTNIRQYPPPPSTRSPPSLWDRIVSAVTGGPPAAPCVGAVPGGGSSTAAPCGHDEAGEATTNTRPGAGGGTPSAQATAAWLPPSAFRTSPGWGKKEKAGPPASEKLGFVFVLERQNTNDTFKGIKLEKRNGVTCQILPNNSLVFLTLLNDGIYMRACILKKNNHEIAKLGAWPRNVEIHPCLPPNLSEDIIFEFYGNHKWTSLIFHDCSSQLISLLSATNARCGANSPARTLPQSILRDIGCLHHDMGVIPVLQKAPPTSSVVLIKGLVDVEVYAAREGEYLGTMGMGWRAADTTSCDRRSGCVTLSLRLVSD